MNRFGSQYTILNANDASVIVGTTSNLSDFYQIMNQTNYQQQKSGQLNLPTVVRKLEEIGKNLLSEANSKSSLTARSFISLIVTQMAGVNEADSNYGYQQIQYLRETQPDLTILFWADGSPGRFAQFVNDQQKDLFRITTFGSSSDSGQQTLTYTLPVIQRIRDSKCTP